MRYSGDAPDPRLAGGPLGADLCAAVGLLLLREKQLLPKVEIINSFKRGKHTYPATGVSFPAFFKGNDSEE